jgi:hypothetical protein
VTHNFLLNDYILIFSAQTLAKSFTATEGCLASVADKVNVNRRIKYNITSLFSAEKQNGNSAKQLLANRYLCKTQLKK